MTFISSILTKYGTKQGFSECKKKVQKLLQQVKHNFRVDGCRNIPQFLILNILLAYLQSISLGQRDGVFVESTNKHQMKAIPAGIYLLKVNNRNTRTRCVICSKLTIKTPERRH